MAASRSAVEGFIDWPPLTTWWTPSERKMRRMPSPVQTATTAQRTGSRVRLRLGVGAGGLAHPPLLFDLLPQVGDPDAAGPARLQRRLDGGADVVGVDVAVPQALPAHHHDRVTQTGPDLAERRERLVGRLEQVHDLVPRSGGPYLPCMPGLPGHPPGSIRSSGQDRPGRRLHRQSGSGRPAATWRRASSRRTNPAPPASTTPAVLSTGSRSGVRARADRAAWSAASRTATRSAP